MEIRFAEIVATLILGVIRCAQTEGILSCKPNVLQPCGASEQVCNATTLQCECPAGWERAGERCRRPEPGGGGVTAALLAAVTLLLLAAAAALVIRRYGLIDYLRQRFNNRGNNNTYEDVMIGRDVPPLSP